jgi:hypothetical protein
MAPIAGPKAKPATRATIAEGSYFRKVTPGMIGNSMKRVQMAATAQKSAATAMRLDDHAPFCVVE